MHTPYIGITDFMTYNQVQRMLTTFKTHLTKEHHRRLHVGVMMSYKTLHGLETKWTKAFPKNEDITAIFNSKETMNCLHYADYEEFNLYSSLVDAISFGGDGMNALQLDMVWPNPEHVSDAVRGATKPLEVILQVGKNAIDRANNDPKEVINRLRDYQGCIHHVLLDKSMGRGLGMDAKGLIPFARAIQEEFPQLGLAAAGGLGPNSINLVKPLYQEFPDISIDAQGKLRPSGNALDPIDWNMADGYLMSALTCLR